MNSTCKVHPLSRTWAFALAALTLCVAAAPITAQSCIATDLGTLPGGHFSRAMGINEQGQVVGDSEVFSNQIHAFLYDKGVMTDLGTFGAWTTEALAINDRGQIVGFSQTSSGETHAFLFERGKLTDLGTLGGAESIARAINNRGEIVGDSTTANGQRHAFLYDKGVMTDLGLGTSQANAINERGQIVGYFYPVSGWPHGFLLDRPEPYPVAGWPHGFLFDKPEKSRVTDLGKFTADPAFFFYEKTASPAGVNNRAQIVGERPDTGRAMLYDDGKILDLGSLSSSQSHAIAINEAGKIVGTSETTGGGFHAFLFDHGVMEDIGNQPGGTMWVADAINNRGEIAGILTTGPGLQFHAVVCKPKRF